MTIHPDAWMSATFGYPVFKILPSGGGETFKPVQDPRAFYFSKVPALSIAEVNALTKAGLCVVDVNVSFERTPGLLADALEAPRVHVAPIRPEDEHVILEIAASSFIYSRFHLDPHVDNALADRIKRDWIQNYILGNRGERLLVGYLDGQPAGFLAELATEENGRPVRTIDLIATGTLFQGAGVGRSLVEFFVSDNQGKAERLRVGTQVANIPSMRLYERCGFRVVASTYVLHGHFSNGQAIA